MGAKQIKLGILISYISIMANMCINMFLTPMLIMYLTDEYYSIYKVIHSFAGPLLLMNLGMSHVVTRTIAKYNASPKKNPREKENTLAICLIISTVTSVLVILFGLVLRSIIPIVYSKTYSSENIQLAQRLFSIFTLTTAIFILTDALKGCVNGNERFVFTQSTQLLQHILRFVMIYVLLKKGYDVVAVALVDCVLNAIIFLLFLVYGVFILHEVPHLRYFDKSEFKIILSFSLAIILQCIINQVNNSMDNVILGATIVDKSVITMYSCALTIFGVYNTLVSSFQQFYTPRATRLIEQNKNGEELTDFVIRPGRWQAFIAVGIIGGFTVLGKQFVTLWIGEKYVSAYFVSLLLIIPVTIPLVQNVCESILNARLLRLYRSIILFVMTMINLAISLILVHFLGFWGAAIGTVASITIGDIILMNIYYKKRLELNVIRMLREIFKGTLLAGAIVTALTYLPLSKLPYTVPYFIFSGIVYVVLYFIALWFISFTKDEKKQIMGTIHLRKL